MENTSSTTPLIDLFGKRFNIPHYQRGYRWEEQEITELLDDLWSFHKSSNKGEFYCLQPIVFKENENGSRDVLDGQQRLTTLYLILVYLEERRFEDGYDKKLFSLNYETRSGCEAFLINKEFTSGINETNIDFYHICQAYSYIDNWFKNEKHRGAKGKLIPILMDENDIGNRNVRFIEYIVEKNVNPIDVFIRLNVGKIPLTDAELIKALLLQSDKYPIGELKYNKMTLFEIASEWDSIEYTLQNEEFWYFISNETNNKPTHIEFIFDLIADKILKEKKYFPSKPSKHATFLILSAYLQDLTDEKKEVNGKIAVNDEKKTRIEAVKMIWQSVTEYFEYFKDWYNNRELYHYIGYLISEKGNYIVDTLIIKSKESSKLEFKNYLKNEIGELIKTTKTMKDLRYEDYETSKSHDKIAIQKILFLHNVNTTLNSQKEKARFPFDLYKKTKKNEKWSLEHIHAQNSENLVKHEHRVTWLKDHIKSFSNFDNKNVDLIRNMEEAAKIDKIGDDVFDGLVSEVYKIVSERSGITDNDKHSIDNLCLIDKNTNSKLNNSIFDVKREKIKRRELEGYYVPICSRNVFLKAYTEYPSNNAYWTQADRKDYLASIQNVYDYFIK